MTDGFDFDFSDLDDVGAVIPSGEPNKQQAGVYNLEVTDYRFYKDKKTEERKIIINFIVLDGPDKGTEMNIFHTLERDYLKYFIQDMDKMGLGQIARKNFSAFCSDAENGAGLMKKKRVQAEVKRPPNPKNPDEPYFNLYLNKGIQGEPEPIPDDDDDDFLDDEDPFH